MMVCRVLALVLLYLCGCYEAKCVLTGQWTNELGSNLTISSVDKGGGLMGSYQRAVTDRVPSPLQGFQQLTDQPTFGFAIRWKYSDAVTVWIGQCFENNEGEQVLQAIFILRAAVPDISDSTLANRFGFFIFRRVK